MTRHWAPPDRPQRQEHAHIRRPVPMVARRSSECFRTSAGNSRETLFAKAPVDRGRRWREAKLCAAAQSACRARTVLCRPVHSANTHATSGVMLARRSDVVHSWTVVRGHPPDAVRTTARTFKARSCPRPPLGDRPAERTRRPAGEGGKAPSPLLLSRLPRGEDETCRARGVPSRSRKAGRGRAQRAGEGPKRRPRPWPAPAGSLTLTRPLSRRIAEGYNPPLAIPLPRPPGVSPSPLPPYATAGR